MDIQLLNESDKKSLFEFEVRNRSWFELSVPPRPNGYYDYNTFKTITDSLLDEQNRGLCFLYVIYEDNKIIGRVNISQINGSLADVGYRICKDSVGKGVGTNALLTLLSKAKNIHGFKILTAKTTTDNMASRKVMENCGFKYISTQKNSGFLNDKSIDFVNYRYDVT